MIIQTNKHFDVLVIGGGIIGMLTARNLQSHGFNIALLDKGSLGRQATWAAGGILSTLKPWNVSPSSQILIDEGRKQFAELANTLKQETGIDPELIQSGMLVMDCDEKQQAFTWAKEKNEIVECLTAGKIQAKEPALAKHFQQALYIPNIAQVHPPKLIQALHQSLMQENISIYENMPVKQLSIKNKRILGVEIDNETLYANNIVLCSGAWTKNLLQQDSSVDIEPVRGQMLLYKPTSISLKQIILRDNSYLIPRKDGHILCGSTLEHVGFENKVTQEARFELESIAQEILPELAQHAPIKQWSALRPGTKRDTPYICKHPDIKGLYINSGHYRYGIVMSIASARIITELIAKAQISSQIASFA